MPAVQNLFTAFLRCLFLAAQALARMQRQHHLVDLQQVQLYMVLYRHALLSHTITGIYTGSPGLVSTCKQVSSHHNASHSILIANLTGDANACLLMHLPELAESLALQPLSVIVC